MRLHQPGPAAGISADAPHSGKPAYVSPSDNIMSPCTAKLSAYRSKNFMKCAAPRTQRSTCNADRVRVRAKPQTLFAKASAKNMSSPVAAASGDSQASADSSADASQASSAAGSI